jgi:hypothetical protein
MDAPSKLLINRVEGYHTHYVGRCADGRQFLGQDCVWVYLNLKRYADDPDFLKSRGEYIVLYTFDSEGNHLNTRHLFAGASANSNREVMANTLEKWIDELGNWEFSDISVKPFQVNIDGFVFGLLFDNETNFVNLMPGKVISFYEPWDGEYWT